MLTRTMTMRGLKTALLVVLWSTGLVSTFLLLGVWLAMLAQAIAG